MADTDQLTRRILAFRDARDWAQFHRPKEIAVSLSLEAAELLEHFQWKTDQEALAYAKAEAAAIGAELCDLLYWTLLMFHELGLDVEQAFSAKMEENQAKYPTDKAKGRHDKYDRLK